MPRKPKNAPPVELADLPPASPPSVPDESVLYVGGPAAPSAADVRAERELDELLQEIGGGDVTVRVSRRSPSGTMQVCGTMPSDSFSIESLTDAFGGGSYQLRFMRGRAEVGRTTVEIDPLVPAKNPRVQASAAPVAPGSAPEMMTMMTGMVGMMMQTMQASQAATLTMISGMAEMMKANRPADNPIDTAVRIAEVMKGGGGGPSDVTQLFSIFEKGLNLGAKVNGDGGDDVMPLVGEGVKGVVALLEGIGAEKKARAAATAIAAPVAPPPAAAVPSSVPVAVVAPPVASEPPMTNARPWIAAVVPFRPQIAGAMGLFSPATVAPMIMEKLTDDQLDDLLSDIEDTTAPGFVHRAFAVLCPGQTMTEPQAHWLAEVAGAIVEATEPEGEEIPAADAAPPGGDPS
jgi:hypothetical protein